ncbi:hypothetical protein FA15DRAFT_662089 [Coprinopsis marcescibilis]|uniref:Uncharacterized protein n=1 Tax=Coprinopsis marcescibilis TaxID=230819 RepID=A0A5C3K9A4_COPMA|nr:hypothetical protein FA15DRAFT_662089 [Coprinopsis marcescibilis]
MTVLDFGFPHTRFAVLNSSKHQTCRGGRRRAHPNSRRHRQLRLICVHLANVGDAGKELGLSRLNGVAEEPREGRTNRCSEQRRRKEKLGGVAALLDDMERRGWDGDGDGCAALRGWRRWRTTLILGGSLPPHANPLSVTATPPQLRIPMDLASPLCPQQPAPGVF